MHITITKRKLDELALKPPAKDCVLWDKTTRRFGVRHTPSGSLSFLIQFRNLQGKSRRLTIGDYGTWTPAQARDEAEKLLRVVDAGGDPVRDRQEERAAITFRELVNTYMDRAERGLLLVKGRRKKPSTVVVDKSRVRHLLEHFGDVAVKSIDRNDCQRCMDRLIEGNHGAARTMGLLGSIFSFAVAEGHIAASPSRAIHRPADGKRSFALDDAGYRKLGVALEAAERRAECWQAVAAIRLLAVTGCRLGEIVARSDTIPGLRWTEFDPQGRCLRLIDSKTGPSIRPLGGPAIELLEAIRRRAGRLPADRDFHVLPGVRDRQQAFNSLGSRTTGAWSRIVGNAYSAHELRHAYASVAGNLGYSELTIGALLGHRGTSVTSGYVKLDRLLVAAADEVARYIWAAMTGAPVGAEIVELPARQRA